MTNSPFMNRPRYGRFDRDQMEQDLSCQNDVRYNVLPVVHATSTGVRNMIKYTYPDGTYCYRALHTAHAVFRNKEGKLIARAEKPDQSEMYEFEIASFELLQSGIVYE